MREGGQHGAPRRAVLAILALAVVATLGACGGSRLTYVKGLALAQCAEHFQAFDRAIADNASQDAIGQPILGFPGLRSDRLLASYAIDPRLTEPATWADWIGRLHYLDQQARRHEWRKLSSSARRQLEPASADPVSAELPERMVQCGDALARSLAMRPELRAHVAPASAIPAAYASWKQVLGLFPVTNLIVAAGAEKARTQARALLAQAHRPEQTVSYVPAVAATRPPRSPDTAAMDRLGLPLADAEQEEALLARHAPHIVVEQLGSSDRIGAAHFRHGARQIDIATPTVYTRVTYTRHGIGVLTQLVYLAWFPERPCTNWNDLLCGAFDGLIWRVTLDPAGTPLVYDTVHPCGCYHMFFPTARAAARPRQDSAPEPIMVAGLAPTLGQDQHIAIRLQGGTHYVVAVGVGEQASVSQMYRMQDEDSLRSVPSGAQHFGWYAGDGLVDGSERAERWLLWVTGVASPGAMRAWGHHATAFASRRHFDDAYLIADHFSWPTEPAAHH